MTRPSLIGATGAKASACKLCVGLCLMLVGGAVAACVPKPRPLTAKEALVSISRGPSQHEGCKIAATVRDTPTIVGQLTGDVSGYAEKCPTISTMDDLRRCAGEHQAQIVDITKERTTKECGNVLNEYAQSARQEETLRVQKGELVLSHTTPDDPECSRYHTTRVEKHDGMTRVIRVPVRDPLNPVASEAKTVALDLQLWKCPASRATLAPGELTWKRRDVSHVDLVKDGRVVDERTDLSSLPALVSESPPAIEFARKAADENSAARIKGYVMIPFAVLALAGDVAAGIGGINVARGSTSKMNYGLLAGGLGASVVFTTAAVTLGFGSASSSAEAATSACVLSRSTTTTTSTTAKKGNDNISGRVWGRAPRRRGHASGGRRLGGRRWQAWRMVTSAWPSNNHRRREILRDFARVADARGKVWNVVVRSWADAQGRTELLGIASDARGGAVRRKVVAGGGALTGRQGGILTFGAAPRVHALGGARRV